MRKGKIKKFKDDLQSFTLLRFLIPEIADPNEKIAIIDPDVFALKPLNELEKITHLQNKIFCTFYNGLPRSEVMIGKAVITYVVKELSPADSPTVVTSDGIKQKSQLRLDVNRFGLDGLNEWGWFGKKSNKSE